MQNNTEEEKKGKLVERPGWFKDQTGGRLSKDQTVVKDQGVTKRSVAKTRPERIEIHPQVKLTSTAVVITQILNLYIITI